MSNKKQISRNSANQELVIALHCSGGNARQWRALSETLDADYLLETPSHIDSIGAATGPGGEFTVGEEAAQSIQMVDRFAGNVHLVGHSYGGAVALNVAMARPGRIASISLYEPCIFHILPQLGPPVLSESTEIHGVAESIQQHIADNDNAAAMSEFVNYWGGPEAWQSLKPEYQHRLETWAPIASLEFSALFCDQTPLQSYRDLQIPVSLLLGECSPAPVRAIANALLEMLPEGQLERLSGMGHMGPLTHADYVSRLVAAHIDSNSSNSLYSLSEPLNRHRGTVPDMEKAA